MALNTDSSVFLFLFFMTLITGSLGNMFIIVMNVTKWRKKQVLNSCDIMVSCISVCNILLLCTVEMFWLWSMITPDFYTNTKITKPLAIIVLFFLSASLWFSAWLCTDYCLRIVNSHHMTFLWLKRRFLKLGPWLVGFSIIISMVITLPGIYDLYQATPPNVMNSTALPDFLNTHCQCFFYVFKSCTSLAFIICSCSAVTIVTSLYRHVKQMQKRMEHVTSNGLAVHIGAARTVVLLLHLSLYISQFLVSSDTASPGRPLFWLCCLLMLSFPTVNSIVLIQGNPQLRVSFLQIVEKFRWHP